MHACRWLLTLHTATVAAAAAVAAASVSVSSVTVWPPPRQLAASGPPRPLHPDFAIRSLRQPEEGGALAAGLARYAAIVSSSSNSRRVASPDALLEITISIDDPTEPRLALHTDYSYELVVRSSASSGRITARSVYGALYGLETFAQLLGAQGTLGASDVLVADFPQYAWRGLMIDSGRRFFPVPLVKNLLDTMASVKLNVLHLHLSDNCRFGVESKLYPELTAALVGELGGFYTQADIKELVGYAKERGIRVVPEFDIPGHTHGWLPLKDTGLKFCSSDARASQLFNDPDGQTLKILTRLLAEMSGLFEDDVFNIGCDETAVTGNCTAQGTASLARQLADTIRQKFNKTPEGWEEILFVDQAAAPDTIVNAWGSHNASSVAGRGRRVVESASSHFYFTEAAPAGAPGWTPCHYDIATGVPASSRALVLGGEMSMWSDTYCYEMQCGAYPGRKPVGAPLFPPGADQAFAKSIGGMIWPRGFVAAASFWNFNSSEDPASPQYSARVRKLTDALAARGSLVCPSGCACDQLTACGTPYLNESLAQVII